MKDFLIKILGGMTVEQYSKEIERFRNASEEFSKKHLTAKEGVTLQGDCIINNEDIGCDFIVTGSMTAINNCRFGTIHVAPWVKFLSVTSCIATKEQTK